MKKLTAALALSLGLALTAGCASPFGMPIGSGALAGIVSPEKRKAAAALATTMGSALRVERTLQDATLLSGNVAAYRVMQTAPASSSTQPSTGTQSPSQVTFDKAAEAAKQEMLKLDAAGRKKVADLQAKRVADDKAEAGARLPAKQTKIVKKQEITTETQSDGGKHVTAYYFIKDQDGTRDITIERKYDAQGTLLQIVQVIEGVIDGVAIDVERAETYHADGSVDIDYDGELTDKGNRQEVSWEKHIAADGTVRGSGTVEEIIGSVKKRFSYSFEGIPNGNELLALKDAAGLNLSFNLDPKASTISVSVDAGPDGRTNLTLDADDEMEDEGKVDDKELEKLSV